MPPSNSRLDTVSFSDVKSHFSYRARQYGEHEHWGLAVSGVHGCVAVVLAIGLAFGASTMVSGQQGYTHGQTVAPVFEGWEPNADGTFNMVFGFYNRNCVENLHIPIGPDNNIEPGGPDRGQPARFYPRRGKFVFRVQQVPADFGDNELVWTLTSQGSTEKAYATLHPEYLLDKRIMMVNEAGFGQRAGEGESLAPVLRIEGDAKRTVAAGQPLTLTAFASDDGLPKSNDWTARGAHRGMVPLQG